MSLMGILLPLAFAAVPQITSAQTTSGAATPIAATTISNSNPSGGSDVNPPDTGSCSLWNGNIFSLNCMQWVVAFLSWTVMRFFAFFLEFTGFLLNYSIEQTILKMKENIDSLQGINSAWTAIRDLANMGFIFVLLYEALLTVVQSTKANAGKTIKNVVIAALFINFSLFFTKVAVDASNILTVGVYDSISRSVPGGFNYKAGNNSSPGAGLSDAFMVPLGLSSIQSGGAAIKSVASGGFGAIFVNGIMGSALLLIASVIFFVMSIMLVVRFIIIVFLLILSPLAFMGSVLPGLRSYANQWTETLTGQALFAPLFMIMVWITLRILNTSSVFNNSQTAGSFASLAAGPNSAISLVFNYAITISFLVGSLIIAKQTASRGGGYAATFMNKGTNYGGAALFGGAAIAGRQTIGRGANRLAESEYMKEKASKKGFGGFSARLALRSADKTRKSSFDARANEFVGKTAGFGTKGIAGYGDLKKGGFKKGADEYIQEQEKFGKSLKISDANKQKFAEEKKNEISNKAKEGHQIYKNDLERIQGTDEYKTSNAKLQEEKAKVEQIIASRSEKERLLAESKKRAAESTQPETLKVEEEKQAILEKELTNLKAQEVVQAKAHAEAAQKFKEVIAPTEKYREDAERLEQSLYRRDKETNKILYDKTGNPIEKNADDFANEANNARLNAYADKLQTRNVINPVRWVAGKERKSGTIRAAAEKIRSAAKDKSAKDKFADLAKEMAKDEAAAAGEGGEAKTEVKPAPAETQAPDNSGGAQTG